MRLAGHSRRARFAPVLLAVALVALAGTSGPAGPAPVLQAGALEPTRLGPALDSTRGEAAMPASRADAAASARRFSWKKRLRRAARFARGRAGAVSFAVVDERGRIRGLRRGVRYSSASLVKAMLLVAYLRSGGVRKRGLGGSQRALLGPMIRASDNDAANSVMARVGTGGLARLARRAGMRRFTPSSVWGGSQLTARDQALFFSRLPGLLPKRHRSYALGLLAGISPGQRWGIPQARPKGWRAHFKGGWYPGDGGWRVHQAALLRRGSRRLGLAVLTQGGPSLEYGAATIRGITRRLLRGYRGIRRKQAPEN